MLFHEGNWNRESQCFQGKIPLNLRYHSTCGTEHVCACACMRVCACVCLGRGRVEEDSQAPANLMGSPEIHTLQLSGFPYQFVATSQRNLYELPAEGLWSWQMSSFGSFLPPSAEYQLGVRCYARSPQTYRRTRYAGRSLVCHFSGEREGLCKHQLTLSF